MEMKIDKFDDDEGMRDFDTHVLARFDTDHRSSSQSRAERLQLLQLPHDPLLSSASFRLSSWVEIAAPTTPIPSINPLSTCDKTVALFQHPGVKI